MPGYHVAVFSAALPPLQSPGGRPRPPGYVYFVSTPAHIFSQYEVYLQHSPSRFPVREASYLGLVSDLRLRLPAFPIDYEVAFYMKNYAGAVDCWLWKPSYPPTCYAVFEVLDIDDPQWWYLGTRYSWRGFSQDVAMPRRLRSQGLRRFYRYMQ